MARLNKPAAARVYAAAQRFVDAALRADDSMFTPGATIWSAPVIADLYERFVDHPDLSADTFEAKFRRQLHGDALTPQQDAPPATYQLAGELLYLHLLPVNGIGGSTKRRIINNILGWSEASVAIPTDLNQALDEGIARAGQFYLSGRNYQIAYLIEFVKRWKELDTAEQQHNLENPWAFKAFAFSVSITYAYAQRELLLHLVHPDTFEAIMSREHKAQIVDAFQSLIDPSITDIDQQLAQIRARLTPQHGEGFTFYSDQIKLQWQDDSKGEEEPETAKPSEDATTADQITYNNDSDALATWQQELISNNSINYVVSEEYPRWLKAQLGERLKIAIINAHHLRIVIDGKVSQSLYFNIKYGPFVVLRDGWEWNLLPLQTGLRHPRTLRRRGTEGWRFFISTENDLRLLKQVVEMTLLTAPLLASLLPRTLGDHLRPYIQLATYLTQDAYTAREIVDVLAGTTPAITTIDTLPDPAQLVDDLQRLRLLEQLDDGRYRRWKHLSDGSADLMLRYAALTLLVRDGDDYMLPALCAPFDGRPYPAETWPLGEDLLNWYAEAKLVQRNTDGTWQSVPGALDLLDDDRTTAQAINTFLSNLQRARLSRNDLSPLGDGALPALPPALLRMRIAEIQRELLIDQETILRIYRSLIAGHHVILSGPPGTGKTHLATVLPRILWRDFEETVPVTLADDPSLPPSVMTLGDPLRREGYWVEVVTATEDWGVRHVIGGIVPKLQRDEKGTTLIYTIGHGCLTRAVLANYAGFEENLLPTEQNPARREAHDHQGNRYRGTWLVIDEFTRAQIDAAFGGLLTTLSGQSNPTLPIPTENGDLAVRLPRDFRLIGTLNSFDRHFLNQISEAMKRRFTFIDVLPPSRERAADERAIAIFNALRRLADNSVEGFAADRELGRATWADVLSVRRSDASSDSESLVRYNVTVEDEAASDALMGLWRIFEAVRVYRQLGTAQAEAVYSALFSGRAIGMPWARALDTALADSLADQLQVLTRDEQRVLLSLLEHPDDSGALRAGIVVALEAMPAPRQQAHLLQLRAVSPSIDTTQPAKLTGEQVEETFGAPQPLLVPSQGTFAHRLLAFVNEKGL